MRAPDLLYLAFADKHGQRFAPPSRRSARSLVLSAGCSFPGLCCAVLWWVVLLAAGTSLTPILSLCLSLSLWVSARPFLSPFPFPLMCAATPLHSTSLPLQRHDVTLNALQGHGDERVHDGRLHLPMGRGPPRDLRASGRDARRFRVRDDDGVSSRVHAGGGLLDGSSAVLYQKTQRGRKRRHSWGSGGKERSVHDGWNTVVGLGGGLRGRER